MQVILQTTIIVIIVVVVQFCVTMTGYRGIANDNIHGFRARYTYFIFVKNINAMAAVTLTCWLLCMNNSGNNTKSYQIILYTIIVMNDW